MKTDIVTTEEIEPPSTMTVPHSRSLVFYKRFFPELSRAEWNDWRWQLRNLITDLYELECILRVSEDEHNAIIRHGTCFPIAITPYYASLLDPNDPSQPLCHLLCSRSSGHGTEAGWRCLHSPILARDCLWNPQ